MTQFDEGYQDQWRWLQGKTLAEARHCLESRYSNLDSDHPYNRGATEATRDYIKELERNASDVGEADNPDSPARTGA